MNRRPNQNGVKQTVSLNIYESIFSPLLFPFLSIPHFCVRFVVFYACICAYLTLTTTANRWQSTRQSDDIRNEQKIFRNGKWKNSDDKLVMSRKRQQPRLTMTTTTDRQIRRRHQQQQPLSPPTRQKHFENVIMSTLKKLCHYPSIKSDATTATVSHIFLSSLFSRKMKSFRTLHWALTVEWHINQNFWQIASKRDIEKYKMNEIESIGRQTTRKIRRKSNANETNECRCLMHCFYGCTKSIELWIFFDFRLIFFFISFFFSSIEFFWL